MHFREELFFFFFFVPLVTSQQTTTILELLVLRFPFFLAGCNWRERKEKVVGYSCQEIRVFSGFFFGQEYIGRVIIKV